MPPVLRLPWCEIARAGVLDGGGGGVARGQTTEMVVVVVVEGEREVDDDERAAAPARVGNSRSRPILSATHPRLAPRVHPT